MNKLTMLSEFICLVAMLLLIVYGLPLYAVAFGITE